MQSNKTVVLGEASESDSEEISLNDEIQVDARDEELDSSHGGASSATAFSNDQASSQDDCGRPSIDMKRGPESSWLSFAEASSSLARLVAYAPYNMLSGSKQATSLTRASDPRVNRRQEAINNLPLLHRTLYMKNQQLHACLDHAFKHPYTKASRDLNTISQRLVGVQRTIQEVEIGIANIKRERSNLDMKINLIS